MRIGLPFLKAIFIFSGIAIITGAYLFYLRHPAEMERPKSAALMEKPEAPKILKEGKRELIKEKEPPERIVKTPNKWDGPLLVPVDSPRGMMVMIPLLCSRGETDEEERRFSGQNVPLEWTPKISNRAYGLIQGSPVKAITQSGFVRDAVCDKVWCLEGECKAHYVGMNLIIEQSKGARSKTVAVVDGSFLSKGTEVSALYRTPALSGLPARYPPSRSNGTFSSLAFERDETLALQIFFHRSDLRGKKSIPVSETYARVLKKTDGEWSNPAPSTWTFLGGHLEPAEALTAFVEKGGPTRILWRMIYPIGGQALMMTKVNPDGSLTKGREFKVGQQPCH